MICPDCSKHPKKLCPACHVSSSVTEDAEQRAIDEAVAKEREACAMAVEGLSAAHPGEWAFSLCQVSDAIRARGNPKNSPKPGGA